MNYENSWQKKEEILDHTEIEAKGKQDWIC